MKLTKSELSTPHKVLLSFFVFIIFGFIGAIVRVFVSPVSLNSNFQEFILQFIPFIIGFGGIAAFLAFLFPRVFGFILTFLSCFSVGN